MTITILAAATTDNRALRQRELGFTWGQFLPEIGDPLLEKMRRARELAMQLQALRREIHSDVAAQWAEDEIRAAKRTAQEQFNKAGFLGPVDWRVC